MADNPQLTQDSAGIAREPTGTIASQEQTTAPEATTAQTSTTPEKSDPTATQEAEKSIVSQDTKSLLNQAKEAPAGAPESYEAFRVPEGFVLDEEVTKEVGGLFKSMSLSQDQAQKLVDFYVARTNEALQAPYDVWRQTQERWVKEVRADPFLGPRLSQVTNTIAKGIDLVAKDNPKLAENFRQIMDVTGAGNNPAFIRMFYEMASRLTEGGHVAGKGPSPAGQQPSGTRPSAAQAMYPNLP